MKKYSSMTDEQLISELRSGNAEIMDYLMDKYKPVVRKKARAMYLFGGETEDLIQEGMIGLIKAVRDYDPSAGNSFSSFAQLCVSRQMYSAIEASKRKKHLPLNSYISLYEESEIRHDGRKVPLIDTITTEQESDPEALYFSREYTEAFVEQLKGKLAEIGVKREDFDALAQSAYMDASTPDNPVEVSPEILKSLYEKMYE